MNVGLAVIPGGQGLHDDLFVSCGFGENVPLGQSIGFVVPSGQK